MRAARARRARGGSLRGTVAEVVERRNAVGLGPQADRARTLDPLVVELDVGLAVQRYPDARAGELDAQPMPRVARDRPIDVLKRVAPAVRGVIERDVVLQRIRARDVV